jgi:hypothetical protein
MNRNNACTSVPSATLLRTFSSLTVHIQNHHRVRRRRVRQSWLERETDEDEPLDENEDQRIAEDDGNGGFGLYWIWILLWI